MDNNDLKILCDPYTRKPFKSFAQLKTAYPIIKGIVYFQHPGEITGSDKKFRRFYNWFAFVYDFFIKSYCFFHGATESKFRKEYLDELQIKKDDNVLEVSIGTGGNIPYLPTHANYYGLDLSIGMLKKCQKNLKKWHRHVELCLGDAEHLPYQNNSFDKVYHMGGFNFFSDKKKAIDEMIRVTKPGGKILIVDENRKAFEPFIHWPLLKKLLKPMGQKTEVPVKLIPPRIKTVTVKELKYWPAWFISLIKPR